MSWAGRKPSGSTRWRTPSSPCGRSVPTLPFDLPNSVRLIDPSMPKVRLIANRAAGHRDADDRPAGQSGQCPNHNVNFGWEYVWHCHILSHEEMDMMHAQVVGLAPRAPVIRGVTRVGNGPNRRVDLQVADLSVNETAFVIERATSGDGPWTVVSAAQSNGNGPTTGTRTFSNVIGNTSTVYVYRVKAINLVGDTFVYTPAVSPLPNFPTMTLGSASRRSPPGFR